jgi:hypothetical protein
MNKVKLFIFFILIFFTNYSYAEEQEQSRLRFSGIPALGFGSDIGFGGGLVASMYEDHKDFAPYKMALGLKIFATTKLVNSHAIILDRLRVFDLPWRIISRIGFYSTPTQNYCGRSADADCSESRAQKEGELRGLSGDALKEFSNRYYQNRYMSLYGDIFSNWLLWEGFAKLSLMNSYRGNYYWHRYFAKKGPYEHSLYSHDFKDNPEQEGYLSTLEIGLMLDSRDHEYVPTRGYLLESTIRGAAAFTGSSWNFFGANLSARFFWPLDKKNKVILASNSIIDAMAGDMPYDAMSRIGGSQSLYDLNAFGGQSIGRGVREQLYVGRFKMIEQLELRYNFWSFSLGRQNFDCVAAAFTDLGLSAWDYNRFAKDMKNVQLSFGPGFRVYWNKTFVIRADLGLSHHEKFVPRFYLVVGNVF